MVSEGFYKICTTLYGVEICNVYGAEYIIHHTYLCTLKMYGVEIWEEYQKGFIGVWGAEGPLER